MREFYTRGCWEDVELLPCIEHLVTYVAEMSLIIYGEALNYLGNHTGARILLPSLGCKIRSNLIHIVYWNVIKP
jgi:hypothetical protein